MAKKVRERKLLERWRCTCVCDGVLTLIRFFEHATMYTERTREMVLDGMKKVQRSFLDHDLVANVRLETYEGDRYFHVPPTAEK